MCRVGGDGSVIEPVWGKHLRRAETTAVVSWSKNWFTNASGFFLELLRIDSQKLNNWNFELLIILFIERDPRDKSLVIQRDSMRCSTMQNQHVGMCTEDLNCKAQKNIYYHDIYRFSILCFLFFLPLNHTQNMSGDRNRICLFFFLSPSKFYNPIPLEKKLSLTVVFESNHSSWITRFLTKTLILLVNWTTRTF